MRANSSQLNFSDDRQKEYQRQQERLKAMTATADKGKVSADLMIENLLKDSLSKVSQVSPHIQRPDTLNLELPPWLMCESEMVPPQYKYLWSVVQSGLDVADTQKVSQLLLTSGLHVDILGYIWNLANKALPGQLTKQEFYIVLALVGLAQTGYAFNNISVLKLIPAPSIPVLDASMLKNQVSQPCSSYNTGINQMNSSYQFQTFSVQGVNSLSSSKEIDKQNEQLLTNSAVKETNLVFNNACDIKQDIGDFKNERLEPNLGYSNAKAPKMIKPHVIEMNKGPYRSSNFPCIGSSPTAGIEDDFSDFQSVPVPREAFDKIDSTPCESGDDFSEFQSANVENLDPFETIVITQKREIPKIPLPKNFSGKLSTLKSNILKISPESERKLKGLTQPESLSSLPESKISSNNKVSTSLSVLGSNHGIGSRLANHSLSARLDRPKHHKHHKIKPNPSPPINLDTEEEIILGVKTTHTENLMPKCFLKKSNNCQTFVLKDTKIRNDEISEFSESEQVRNECEPPSSHSGENTRQIEIPMLGTFNETVLPTLTKSQSSSIDLISVQEDKYSALREIEVNMNQEKSEEGSKETNDEFGDFLSADIPPPPELVPAVTTPQEPIPELPKVTSASAVSLFAEEEEKESWGEWNFSTESESKSADIPVSTSSVTPPLKTEEDIFNSFSLLTVDESEEKKKPLASAQPLTTIQDDIFGGIESNNDLIASTSSHNSDNWSSFAFEYEQSDKINSFSPQIKSPSLINNHSDNEYSDLFTSDLKPSSVADIITHDSLPSLNLKMSPTEELEHEAVWRKCIESCHSLIQKGFEIFNNITVKSVLDEVFSAPRTSDYLNHLYIAYQISKRISQNWNEISSTQEDLERIWRRLEELCSEYKIKLIQDEDNISEGEHQCKICSGYTSQNFISQGISTYHPSCANLWINLVDETLPCCT